METCVQAVEWTLDENTRRIERNESKSKDEDSIFIEGKCEAQEVTLTYIFNEDSSFQISDPSLSLTIPGLCQANWNAVNDQHKKTIGWIVAAATSFALLTLLVAICLFVRHKYLIMRHNCLFVKHNSLFVRHKRVFVSKVKLHTHLL